MSLTIFAGSSADIPTTVALSPSRAASFLNCASIRCQAGTNEKPSTNQTLYCFPLLVRAAHFEGAALRLDEPLTRAVIASRNIPARNDLIRMDLSPSEG